jgi:RNA polymerase sigma factor (sigma-70 family)
MSVYTAHTDQELMCLLQRGDEAAFNEIYQRYWKKLFSAAYSRLRTTDDAREIVQQVFFIVWKHREHLRILHLANYLSAMVRHAVYRHLATTGRANAALPHDEWHAADNSDAEYRHLVRWLEKFAESLPCNQRIVFVECKLRDQSVKDVSAALGISRRTAEGYIARTLKTLRKKLHTDRFLQLLWLYPVWHDWFMNY